MEYFLLGLSVFLLAFALILKFRFKVIIKPAHLILTQLVLALITVLVVNILQKSGAFGVNLDNPMLSDFYYSLLILLAIGATVIFAITLFEFWNLRYKESFKNALSRIPLAIIGLSIITIMFNRLGTTFIAFTLLSTVFILVLAFNSKLIKMSAFWLTMLYTLPFVYISFFIMLYQEFIEVATTEVLPVTLLEVPFELIALGMGYTAGTLALYSMFKSFKRPAFIKRIKIVY